MSLMYLRSRIAIACFTCFTAALGWTTFGFADTVNMLPKETLSNFMELSVRDNTKVLAPARAAFERGDIVEAQRLLERAVAESGIIPHPAVQVASWLLTAKNFVAAQMVMESIAVSEPDRPDVRWMFAEVARSQGRLFDAWTHITLATKAKPPTQWDPKFAKHMQSLIAKSQALIADQRGDYATSEPLFKELLKQGIRTVEVYMALGRASFFQGRPDEAFKYFELACKPESIKAVPELLMAALFEQKGEQKKTEEWFQKGDSKGTLDAERIRLEYVRWLIRQNRSDDARKVATKFRPSDENRADFEYLIALAERMEGKFSIAEKLLSRLNRANPTSFSISNQLALVLAESEDQGKLGRAMQLATTNVRNNPKSSDAISTYGWVQHRSGDSAGAEQTFNVLLQTGQASRDVAYYVAKVKSALGQTEFAGQVMEKAKNSEGEFFNAFRVDEKKVDEKKGP